MSAEEDNFDIDIYGDGGGGEEYQAEETQGTENAHQGADSVESNIDAAAQHEQNYEAPKSETESARHGTPGGDSLHIGSTGTPVQNTLQAPKQAPQAQGLKRKEGPDDRPTDPGATSALFLSDLHWWITDDDIRGWANQSGCEDELQEVTFSEHKVNGKSKGQAYTLFNSPQAATAVKHQIESFGDGQVYKQKFSVTFSNPFLNPFKTLPKDGNNRRDSGQPNRGYNNQGSPAYNQGGGYRGRGGYNSRGGMNNMGGGYNRGGYQQPPQPHPLPGSYPGGAGYPQGGMPGQPYGGFQGGGRGSMMGGGGMRGGSMGMRGGRGGGQMNGMMGMPMNMGGMPGQMGMGMPQMNAGMGMQGFPNPGFFPQQTDANWNPHGAKRTRQE